MTWAPAWPHRILLLALCVAVLAGCARGGEAAPAGPAGPASAPAQGQAITGVSQAGPLAVLAADTATGTVGGLSTGGDEVLLFGNSDRRTVRLPGQAAGLAPGKPGQLLAPARDRIFRIDVRQATLSEIRVDGDARAIAYRPDGTLAVGLAAGVVRVIRDDGAPVAAVEGLAGADALATAGDSLLVLDRNRSAVTAVNVAAGAPGATLNAGESASAIADGGAGRVFAADVRGGALLVFTAAPLVLRQRFPVGSSPYALAYDQHTSLVWVTLTATNEVAAYDVSAGIPKEVRRHATVRQPNSVAVNGRTGTVYVGSASGDGLQQIGGR